jgi:hypothetical protein
VDQKVPVTKPLGATPQPAVIHDPYDDDYQDGDDLTCEACGGSGADAW